MLREGLEGHGRPLGHTLYRSAAPGEQGRNQAFETVEHYTTVLCKKTAESQKQRLCAAAIADCRFFQGLMAFRS
jgi:hypothetical protein